MSFFTAVEATISAILPSTLLERVALSEAFGTSGFVLSYPDPGTDKANLDIFFFMESFGSVGWYLYRSLAGVVVRGSY